jgi:uncharacterized protein (TIGR03067 family)
MSDCTTLEATPLLPSGAFRVAGFIAGPASSLSEDEAKKLRVSITNKRLVIDGGDEKEEFAIVAIDESRWPRMIDLRDKASGRIYRGIYERRGKRLRLCIQFWTTGDAKTSDRPASFSDASPANAFGPTLFNLEPR